MNDRRRDELRTPDPAQVPGPRRCTHEIIGHEPFFVSLADLYADIGGDIIAVEAVPEADAHKIRHIDPSALDGRRSPQARRPPTAILWRPKQSGVGAEIQLTDATEDPDLHRL